MARSNPASARHPPDAQCFGCDQHPLRVEPVDDVGEALAFLADPVLNRHPQVVDEQLVGAGVAAHLRNRADADVCAVGIGEEQRHAVGLLGDLVIGRRAGQQQDLLGLECLGDPHLSAVDHVAVTAPFGEGGDAGGVHAGAGLGDTEAHVQVAFDDARQGTRLEFRGAVHDHRLHAEDRQMDRGGRIHRPARAGDFLEQQGGLGDPETMTAVLLGDGHAQPAAADDGVVELLGIRASGPSPSSTDRRTSPPVLQRICGSAPDPPSARSSSRPSLHSPAHRKTLAHSRVRRYRNVRTGGSALLLVQL
ncbi:MAG: hypothetical protein QOI28_4698 [Mycobacterium sp.]|nr:hypothetical protein [Mycobacterium sp.]